MNPWKEQRLNDLYRQEQENYAEQARTAREAQDSETESNFWTRFTEQRTR
jgi:hypothetical protein